MNKSALWSALLFFFVGTGCTKGNLSENLSTPPPVVTEFVKYVIPKGEHFATTNSYKSVETTELKFTVRFDSSCIYRTKDPDNQWDINKLYGFSDNDAMHHQFSARFGWRWSEGALRVFAYTYNSGERTSKELAVVPIGKDVHCSIKVSGASYVFSVNEKKEIMPRQSKTVVAKGYQLYPYFGGDEVAPHEVRILIKEEK
jgi:hypothetical protein